MPTATKKNAASMADHARSFGIASLVKKSRIPVATLNRVLRGWHREPPMQMIAAIAKATTKHAEKVDGFPSGDADWLKLWKKAHKAARKAGQNVQGAK